MKPLLTFVLLTSGMAALTAGKLSLTWGGMDKKILVVNTDMSDRGRHRALLQRAGYQVITAENGREALEKVQSEQPGLVVMGQKMPTMEMLEAIKRLKSNEQTAHIPIIIAELRNSLEAP